MRRSDAAFARHVAGWLEQIAPPSQVKTIYSFGIERVQVYDDFDVEPEAWET